MSNMDFDPLGEDPLALDLAEDDDESSRTEDPLSLPVTALPHTNKKEDRIIFSLPVIKLEGLRKFSKPVENAPDFIHEVAPTSSKMTLEKDSTPVKDSFSSQDEDAIDIKPDVSSVGDNEEASGPVAVVGVLNSQTNDENSLIVVSNITSGAGASSVDKQLAADDSNECETNEGEIETIDIKPLTSLQNDWRLENRSHKRKLSYLLETPGLNQDVIFIVGQTKEKICAHSFILWLNSPIFEDIMKRKNAETKGEECSRIVEITLEDVNVEVFRIVLQYMYTEEIGVTRENVLEVYKVAKKTFQIEDLAQDCAEIMKKTISLDNVVGILQLGQECEETELYQQAYFFILQNGEMFLQTPECLELSDEGMLNILGSDHLAASEITVFHAAMKWASNKCLLQGQPTTPENVRKAMGEIIYKVRIPLLTAEEFKLQVVSSKILEPTEVIDLFTYFTPPFETTGSNFPFSTTPRLSQNEVEIVTNNVCLENPTATCSSSAAEVETNNEAQRTRTRRKAPIRPVPVVKREIQCEEKRTRTQKKGQIRVRNTAFIVSSSDESKSDKNGSNGSSSSSDEDAWAKSSEEQDSSDSDSSDPLFKPPPRSRAPKRKLSMETSEPINKKPKMPGLQQINTHNPTQPMQSKAWNKTIDSRIRNISTYIRQLQEYPHKENVGVIRGSFKIFAPIPTQRVILPNLKKIVLNLVSPQLNCPPNTKTWSKFKDVALTLFRSLDLILFVSKFSAPEPPQRPVNLFALDRIWASGLKVELNLNGVNILNLNEPQGNFMCCCVRNPSLTNLFNGLRLRKNALTRLTIAECDFRLFPSISAIQSLKYLRILKVGGLQGINEFLQQCPNLEEFYWDGNGTGMGGERTLNLDEDLRLFSFSCTLKKLVVSNLNINIKDPNFLPRAAILPNPRFLFCEFSPKIMNHFTELFPFMTEIHLKKCPRLPFFEKIVSLSSIQHVGIWSGRLMTSMKLEHESSSAYTTFLTEPELWQHMRDCKTPNEIGTYANHSFFLKKHNLMQKYRGPGAGSGADLTRWEVKEVNRKPNSRMLNDEAVTKIYEFFEYASICDLIYYRSMNLF